MVERNPNLLPQLWHLQRGAGSGEEAAAVSAVERAVVLAGGVGAVSETGVDLEVVWATEEEAAAVGFEVALAVPLAAVDLALETKDMEGVEEDLAALEGLVVAAAAVAIGTFSTLIFCFPLAPMFAILDGGSTCAIARHA